MTRSFKNLNHPQPYITLRKAINQYLLRGVIPWREAWKLNVGAPVNFHSRRSYGGINIFLLNLPSFESPWWMTNREIQLRGGSIHKGSQGIEIISYDHPRFYRMGYAKIKPIFNDSQIDGIRFPAGVREQAIPETKRMDLVFAMLGIPPSMIVESGIDSRSDSNARIMNILATLENAACSEFTKERLIIEMTTAILCARNGIDRTSSPLWDSKNINGWLVALNLKGRAHWPFNAAYRASKAIELIYTQNS